MEFKSIFAHLFAMARAVGDAACFRHTSLAPVNDLHNAVRQAAGLGAYYATSRPTSRVTESLTISRLLFDLARGIQLGAHGNACRKLAESAAMKLSRMLTAWLPVNASIGGGQ